MENHVDDTSSAFFFRLGIRKKYPTQITTKVKRLGRIFLLDIEEHLSARRGAFFLLIYTSNNNNYYDRIIFTGIQFMYRKQLSSMYFRFMIPA